MSKIKDINPPRRVVTTQYNTGNEMFVPGWDKSMGGRQLRDHLEPRESMPDKMTPAGRTRLIKD